jgi:hypothetical protein
MCAEILCRSALPISFAVQFAAKDLAPAAWAKKIQPLTFVKTICEYDFSSSRLSITAAAVRFACSIRCSIRD